MQLRNHFLMNKRVKNNITGYKARIEQLRDHFLRYMVPLLIFEFIKLIQCDTFVFSDEHPNCYFKNFSWGKTGPPYDTSNCLRFLKVVISFPGTISGRTYTNLNEVRENFIQDNFFSKSFLYCILLG